MAETLYARFRHPIPRLLISFTIIFLNFLMLAEDPVAHSFKEAEVPLVGNLYAFVFNQYAEGTGLRILKVLCWMVSLALGMLAGKALHKRFLRPRWAMFSGDKGSWMVMFLMSIPVMAIGSQVYNALLLATCQGYKCDELQITAFMGFKNRTFYRAAGCGTFLGDFITWLMVTDGILQTKQLYPQFAPRVRDWWTRYRIIGFWAIFLSGCAMVLSSISSGAFDWERFPSYLKVPTNEVTRALLASVITCMDFMIVMTDWGFPDFSEVFNISLPGLKMPTLNFALLRGHDITITAKWFQYGILMCVTVLDINMLKNQLIYEPSLFGQYTGPDDRIYTVEDLAVLRAAESNPELISWEARQGMGDPRMESTYIGASWGLKCLPLLIVLANFVMFFVLFRKMRAFADTPEDRAATMRGKGAGPGREEESEGLLGQSYEAYLQ